MEQDSQVIPLFKSNFSIGKSILTLSSPPEIKIEDGEKDVDVYPDCPKSIFSILREEEMTELVLLEDNFYSFYSAQQYCADNKIKLIYGVNIHFSEGEETPKGKPITSKIAVFIKNKAGYGDLIKLHAKMNVAGFCTKDDLDELITKNLIVAIPFYDSFIHKNSMQFCTFSDFILKFKPVFFVEDGGLPFDEIIKKSVTDICGDKYQIIETKTICYYKRADVDAFLAYKCICNRSFGKKSLSKPNFEHFSSDEFCWESFKEEF